MNYTIKPMCMGYNIVDSSILMLRTKIGEPNKNTVNMFLIQGGDETILVETGSVPIEINPPERLDYWTLEGYRSVPELLADHNVKCSDITRIILTHLHYDHCWNLELFPGIPIYVQVKELENAVNPIPWDVRIYSLNPTSEIPDWAKHMNRIVRIDGDYDLLPGIKLLLTPGHTKGSQCVLVDTKEGKHLLTGDFIPRREGYEKQIPNGIINDLNAWSASYKKVYGLVDSSEKILPSHEWKVHERKVYG